MQSKHVYHYKSAPIVENQDEYFIKRIYIYISPWSHKCEDHENQSYNKEDMI